LGLGCWLQDSLEARQQKVEEGILALDRRLLVVETKTDSVDNRLGTVENKLPDISEKFGELKNWRQISFVILARNAPRLRLAMHCQSVGAAIAGWLARSGKI
jgi:hypothetical protein